MSETDHRSAAPAMGTLIAARLSRRSLLAGLSGALAWGAGGPLLRQAAAAQPGFGKIAAGSDARQHLPPGYRAQILIRWGDPVLASAPAWDFHRQSTAAAEAQFGYNNDFLAYFPLPRGEGGARHGLLAVNHEYTREAMMFPDPAAEPERIAIAMAAHGLSIIEIMRGDNGDWRVLDESAFARRITATSPIRLSGPAAGHARLRTRADPGGRTVRGTLNNCAGGTTPWGTLLSAEENFHLYFEGAGEDTEEAANHRRYGVGTKNLFAWAATEERFSIAREPHEPNRFGWIVEIDPYDASSVPTKRTALGRFAHEGATCALDASGRLVVYMGDDGQFEYLYRFVTRRRFEPDKPEANRDLLDEGTLAVARFDADGGLEWLPLIAGQGPLTGANGFSSAAEIAIETRRAADLLEPTPLDRPEDIEIDPLSGHVFVILTNNTKRGQGDAANPRGPNPYGHILELIPPSAEDGGTEHAAPRFGWEVLLLGGDPRDPTSGARAHPAVTAEGWIANPDNCVFDREGRLWIASDGQPKSVGRADGLWLCPVAGPERALSRLFYRAPAEAEVCGPCFAPDERTLFLAIQHPGDDGRSGWREAPTRWPDFDPEGPPRPAVIAITKDDGGKIGS